MGQKLSHFPAQKLPAEPLSHGGSEVFHTWCSELWPGLSFRPPHILLCWLKEQHSTLRTTMIRVYTLNTTLTPVYFLDFTAWSEK